MSCFDRDEVIAKVEIDEGQPMHFHISKEVVTTSLIRYNYQTHDLRYAGHLTGN